MTYTTKDRVSLLKMAEALQSQLEQLQQESQSHIREFQKHKIASLISRDEANHDYYQLKQQYDAKITALKNEIAKTCREYRYECDQLRQQWAEVLPANTVQVKNTIAHKPVLKKPLTTIIKKRVITA